MQVTHSEIKAMLHRIGRSAEIPDVLGVLPDPVDIDRDAVAMERFGLLPDQLMEALGANG
jgi:hypothetical protein